jgi:hypothetical protein
MAVEIVEKLQVINQDKVFSNWKKLGGEVVEVFGTFFTSKSDLSFISQAFS